MIEDARRGISYLEAELMDKATCVLAVPAVRGFPRAVHVLAQAAHEDAVVRVLLRQLDVRRIVRIRGRAEICTADVDKRHLDPVHALGIPDLLGIASDVCRSQ